MTAVEQVDDWKISEKCMMHSSKSFVANKQEKEQTISNNRCE